MTTIYYFQAFYKKLGVGAAPTDIPTINVLNIADGSLLVTAQNVTKQANMAGLCTYVYSGADNLNLVGNIHSTDTTLDEQDLPCLGVTSLAGASSGDSPGVTSILADYARRTGDYSTLTAAQVWAALTSALTTSGSIGKWIVDKLDALISSRATPADVSVSVAVSSTVAAGVSTGSLEIETAYTFRQTVESTVTDDLTTATKLWLAIKRHESNADSEALVFIEKTAGLTVIAGAAYTTTAHGSLVVRGVAGAWEIDIFLNSVASALLENKAGYYPAAGIKAEVGDEISVWDGDCNISKGIVKAVA